MSDADPYALGVSPSEIAERYASGGERPPYVRRTVDDVVETRLREDAFVLLVGSSKSGKSRTAYEACVRLWPERTLFAPELPGIRPAALSELAEEGVFDTTDASIVWLDDIQDFIRAHALPLPLLNAWRDRFPSFAIVGTIRETELEQLRRSGRSELGAEAEVILDLATAVSIPAAMTSEEERLARSLYPDEEFHEGVGVHFVAGPRLVERYLTGGETEPFGQALVTAAIDRRRAGLITPAQRDELVALATTYFESKWPRTKVTPEVIDAGFRWATEPLMHDIALLNPAPEGIRGFAAFEYIVAFRDGEVGGGRTEPIPDAIWRMLVDQTDGWGLRGLGGTAAFYELWPIAEAAFEKATNSTDDHLEAHALTDLARVYRDRGDIAKAERLLRLGMESQWTHAAAEAGFTLGRLVSESDPPSAEKGYRVAIAKGQDVYRARGAVNLGLLIRARAHGRKKDRDDTTSFSVSLEDGAPLSDEILRADKEAQELFEYAMGFDDEEAVGNGANALAVLHELYGRTDEAERAFQRGLTVGSQLCQVNYASLLTRLNRPADAGAVLGDVWEQSWTPVYLTALAHEVGAEIAIAEDKPRRAALHLRAALKTIDGDDRDRIVEFLEDVERHLEGTNRDVGDDPAAS